MSLIRLDDLIINKHLSSVTVNGEERSVEPKLFELLILFCQHHEKIVTRQQILDAIWPNSIVTDNAVNKLVASLRKLLNDDPRSPKYIQTVPKRGYKLLVDVEFVTPAENKRPFKIELQGCQSSSSENLGINQGAGVNRKFWLLGFLSAAVLVAYLLLLWRPSSLEATSTAALSAEIKTQELTKLPGLERSPVMNREQSLLLFLREDKSTGHRSLWRKDLTNEQESRVEGLSPYVSRLIELEEGEHSAKLVYLAQESAQCHVSSVELLEGKRLGQSSLLFDCTGMRVFDVVWAPQKSGVYYTAQAEHENASRVYFYDTDAKSHRLVSQPEASGIGNRGIDLSPDGKKLLIVNLDRDFNSQLYVLELSSNNLQAGLKVPYDIKMASWSHDSEQVLYYDPAPSQQLIRSGVNGEGQHVFFSVSEYLENSFSRIKNGKDLLFATTNLNFNNRWIYHIEDVAEVSNSTVYDMKPTLAHHSLNYAFVSTRSGRGQVYYGDLTSGESRVISRLNAHRWLHYLSFSPDDSTLMVGDYGRLWLIDLKQHLNLNSVLQLTEESASLMPEGSIVSARWLSNDFLYLKIDTQNVQKGYVWSRHEGSLREVDNRWQMLFSDHKAPDTLYMIDQFDSELFSISMDALANQNQQPSIKFHTQQLQALGTHIESEFSDIKLYDGNLYYVTASNSGNSQAYDYQIEVKPLLSAMQREPQIYKTSCSCGYDVADSGFMLSEQVNIEGDIRRTLQN